MKTIKSYLKDNKKLLSKYVDAGIVVAHVATFALDKLMRHLLDINDLDPNMDPQSNLLKELTKAIDIRHEYSYDTVVNDLPIVKSFLCGKNVDFEEGIGSLKNGLENSRNFIDNLTKSGKYNPNPHEYMDSEIDMVFKANSDIASAKKSDGIGDDIVDAKDALEKLVNCLSNKISKNISEFQVNSEEDTADDYDNEITDSILKFNKGIARYQDVRDIVSKIEEKFGNKLMPKENIIQPDPIIIIDDSNDSVKQKRTEALENYLATFRGSK